jgi:hypothetical protein
MARERLAANDTEESLLDRRSYLKLAGSAVAATAASSAVGSAETDVVGYGGGGFGTSPYGGGDSGTTNPLPVIDEFTVSPSERLGDDRMFSVRWSASNEAGDLDAVELVVVDDAANVNFSVTDASGANASGWELFQFPIDSAVDVTVRVTDSAGNVTKETKSVTL